jgi:hypothetical protein
MKRISILICGLFLSTQLLALGQTSHRVTGELATLYLNDHSKHQLQKLLGNQSLAEISTYVDKMQSEDSEYWKKTSKPFHFVTVPDDKTYVEVGAPVQGDAVSALKKYSELLINNQSSTADKAFAVKWIVHIIGDLHQPLHAGNGLDRGGNQFKVTYFGKKTNLHSVWDYHMVASNGLSYTEMTAWLANKITEQQAQAWRTTDPLVWIEESIAIRKSIYPKNTELRYAYPHKHLPILNKRIQMAGVRIAHYLNHLLAQSNN